MKDKKEDEAEAGMPPELKEAIEKKKKEKEAKADEAEAELSEDAFEDVETSEATMVEPEAVDELDQARASVADWFSNHVLTNK
jgi:TRAP-type C4-dicarboxylate transport system substrate-binding protein